MTRTPWRTPGIRGSAILALVVALGSCSSSGPPPIRLGAECAGCGMAIEDLQFACQRQVGHEWRVYDSIECLARDGGPSGSVWLADYDRSSLAPAESLWVVKGEFPSPMGGGLAAFRDRAAADEVAGRTHGRVGRFSEIVGAGGGSP